MAPDSFSLGSKRPAGDVPPRAAPLLRFLMVRVLAAGVAELRELETSGGCLLVFGRGVVPVLALGALKGDDLAHDVSSLVWPATSAGKRTFRISTSDTPRRRA